MVLKHLRRRHSACFKKLTFIIFILIYCEVIIYYVVIGQCSWPHLKQTNVDSFAQDEMEPLKMMLLSDTHLLGPKRGHWLDKLRREWQMHRTFQTALTLHRPDVVAFLGDVFDEGQWSNDEEFKVYMKRFWDLFYVPSHVKVLVTVGNHDVGFHYRMHEYFVDRFEENFNTSAVQLTAIRGNLFVTVNSMALYGDSCNFCARARMELRRIRHKLRCSERKVMQEKSCRKEDMLETNGRPVVLMALFTPDDMAVSKCYIPKETTVIFLYIAALVALVISSLRSPHRRIW
ncbi:per1-like protein PGAP5 isoform X3 [Dermacentor variabilis]|uniref:per1-like protein PGAP5 isoform X3 n=1 Tax=Dermacentor variabilis TaxID=34621 RepID=UPI003F5C3275